MQAQKMDKYTSGLTEEQIEEFQELVDDIAWGEDVCFDEVVEDMEEESGEEFDVSKITLKYIRAVLRAIWNKKSMWEFECDEHERIYCTLENMYTQTVDDCITVEDEDVLRQYGEYVVDYWGKKLYKSFFEDLGLEVPRPLKRKREDKDATPSKKVK